MSDLATAATAADTAVRYVRELEAEVAVLRQLVAQVARADVPGGRRSVPDAVRRLDPDLRRVIKRLPTHEFLSSSGIVEDELLADPTDDAAGGSTRIPKPAPLIEAVAAVSAPMAAVLRCLIDAAGGGASGSVASHVRAVASSEGGRVFSEPDSAASDRRRSTSSRGGGGGGGGGGDSGGDAATAGKPPPAGAALGDDDEGEDDGDFSDADGCDGAAENDDDDGTAFTPTVLHAATHDTIPAAALQASTVVSFAMPVDPRMTVMTVAATGEAAAPRSRAGSGGVAGGSPGARSTAAAAAATGAAAASSAASRLGLIRGVHELARMEVMAPPRRHVFFASEDELLEKRVWRPAKADRGVGVLRSFHGMCDGVPTDSPAFYGCVATVSDPMTRSTLALTARQYGISEPALRAALRETSETGAVHAVLVPRAFVLLSRYPLFDAHFAALDALVAHWQHATLARLEAAVLLATQAIAAAAAGGTLRATLTPGGRSMLLAAAAAASATSSSDARALASAPGGAMLTPLSPTLLSVSTVTPLAPPLHGNGSVAASGGGVSPLDPAAYARLSEQLRLRDDLAAKLRDGEEQLVACVRLYRAKLGLGPPYQHQVAVLSSPGVAGGGSGGADGGAGGSVFFASPRGGGGASAVAAAAAPVVLGGGSSSGGGGGAPVAALTAVEYERFTRRLADLQAAVQQQRAALARLHASCVAAATRLTLAACGHAREPPAVWTLASLMLRDLPVPAPGSCVHLPTGLGAVAAAAAEGSHCPGCGAAVVTSAADDGHGTVVVPFHRPSEPWAFADPAFKTLASAATPFVGLGADAAGAGAVFARTLLTLRVFVDDIAPYDPGVAAPVGSAGGSIAPPPPPWALGTDLHHPETLTALTRWAVPVLCALLTPEMIVELLAAVLTEQSVIFVSGSLPLEAACRCVAAVPALLGPLAWQQNLRPTAPLAMQTTLRTCGLEDALAQANLLGVSTLADIEMIETCIPPYVTVVCLDDGRIISSNTGGGAAGGSASEDASASSGAAVGAGHLALAGAADLLRSLQEAVGDLFEPANVLAQAAAAAGGGGVVSPLDEGTASIDSMAAVVDVLLGSGSATGSSGGIPPALVSAGAAVSHLVCEHVRWLLAHLFLAAMPRPILSAVAPLGVPRVIGPAVGVHAGAVGGSGAPMTVVSPFDLPSAAHLQATALCSQPFWARFAGSQMVKQHHQLRTVRAMTCALANRLPTFTTDSTSALLPILAAADPTPARATLADGGAGTCTPVVSP